MIYDMLNPKKSGNILQLNPSGVNALSLHGTSVGDYYIQTLICPVRYADFDGSQKHDEGQGKGVVEKYIGDLIDKVNMIVTISQAGKDDYHIDVFATATRDGFNDNMDFKRIDGSKSVNDAAPETIVTTLPEGFTKNGSRAVFYGKYFIDKSEYIKYKYNLTLSPHNSTKELYPTEKIYYGPGGNYLSDEIFYRVAKMRSEKKPALHTGHFHIEKIQKDGEELLTERISKLLENVKKALTEGIKGMEEKKIREVFKRINVSKKI